LRRTSRAQYPKITQIKKDDNGPKEPDKYDLKLFTPKHNLKSFKPQASLSNNNQQLEVHRKTKTGGKIITNNLPSLEEAEPINTNKKGSRKLLELVSPVSNTDLHKPQQSLNELNPSAAGNKDLGDSQFQSLEELKNESKLKILKELTKTHQLTKSSQEVNKNNPEV